MCIRSHLDGLASIIFRLTSVNRSTSLPPENPGVLINFQFHVLDVQAFFESSNRLTSVNRSTSLPGPPRRGGKDSPGVLINFQFNRLTSVRFHLDGIASIILQMLVRTPVGGTYKGIHLDGLASIIFQIHVLKYKHSSNHFSNQFSIQFHVFHTNILRIDQLALIRLSLN